MWFSLFAVVLILAITFYQGLLGLFSAAITCILAVLSAALAFGLYEDVYYSFLLDRQPSDGRAIALIAIFVVSLLVLRVAFDSFIKGNMQFPLYVDRGGGGVFGLITALVIIGTLTTAVQMLTFPPTFLGFNRYRIYDPSGALVTFEPKEPKQSTTEVAAGVEFAGLNYKRQSIWLNPDGFAVAMASHLSANALQGRTDLQSVHPNLLDELHWARFSPLGQKMTVALKADAMRVEAVWTLGEDELYVVQKPEKKDANTASETSVGRLVKPTETADRLPSGDRWLVVRVKLESDACDDSSNFRFTPQQVRLVLKGTKGQECHMVGLNVPPEDLTQARDKRKDWHYRVPKGKTITRPLGSSQGRFEFVFEVPKDAEPWFIEYKLNARAEVKPAQEEPPEPLGADEAKKPAPKDESDGAQGNNSQDNNAQGNNSQATNQTVDPNEPGPGIGRIARVHANSAGSFYSQDLPFKLTKYTVIGECEVRSGRIQGGPGRLVAPLTANDDPQPGDQPVIEGFDVPENNKLLHLSVSNLTPGSLYGQVSDFAAQNNNCGVVEPSGKIHPAIGMYAIATSGRQRLFELVYFDETSRMGSAAVPKLDRIKRDDLKRNYELYYLFEVPPGTKVTRFRNPRGREEGLSAQNLVAPR